MKDKTIIGRIVKIDLPEFGIFNIEAKIDTGAFNSAIHCTNMKEEMTPSGMILVFTLLDPKHSAFNGKRYSSHNFRMKIVKSSVGEQQKRYQVITKMILAGREIEVSLNLSDRKKMTKSVLIGRTAIAKNFLVDVSKKV